jgi:hypothetical protein
MINALSPLLLAAVTGLSSLNTAYSMHAPVKVAACDLFTGFSTISTEGSTQAVPQTTTLTIRFANTAPKIASMVRFAVTDDLGNTYEIKDAGMFAPGVAINHVFESPVGASTAKCSVEAVTYQDGSTWLAESN